MSVAGSSVYDIVDMEELFGYANKVKALILQELGKRLPSEAELIDVFVDISDVDDKLAKEKIEIEIDVTRLLGLKTECLWYEGVYESCQDGISQNIDDYPECNEESDKYNEEECKRRIDACVEDHIEEFKEENCGLPFYFNYKNPPTSEANLVELEDEDNYRYCCGVALRYTYTQYPFKDALKDIVGSENAIEYLVDTVVAEVLRVIDALKALAP